MIKQYRCLEPKTRQEHFICDVVFHEFSLYYEKGKEKLQRLSSSSSEDKKSSESESEQEHEPKRAAPKQPLATVARGAQKTKSRNPKSNLSLAWQLSEDSKRKNEKTS